MLLITQRVWSVCGLGEVCYHVSSHQQQLPRPRDYEIRTPQPSNLHFNCTLWRYVQDTHLVAAGALPRPLPRPWLTS